MKDKPIAWSLETIARNYEWSESTARKIVYRPDFPKPIRVGNSHPRWESEEVIEWFRAQKEAA